jgi:8-oxo-dGDP phosphatase
MNHNFKKYKTISSDIKFSNPYWQYALDNYILPNGQESQYHYVKSGGSCIIIPKQKNNTFVMVRQYRYLNKKFSLEFPGGGIKNNTSPLENAKNELIEEAGLYAGKMKKIGEFNPFNGVTNEICSVYLAEELKGTTPLPEDSEEFEILNLTIEEINKNINDNQIWDGMTLASWALYQFS